MAKRPEESEPSGQEVGIVRVDEPAAEAPPPAEPKAEPPPAPPRVPPPAPPHPATGPSFGERVGRFFRFILRLVLLLILLGLFGIALYLAVPWLYQRYIRPVEQNTAQVRELQSRLGQTEQELIALQSRLEALEDAQDRHAQSLDDLDGRLGDLEQEIAARSESLAALEKLQSELEQQNRDVSAELERQIDLLKSMELLSRARLSMYQSNFGLAKQDVQIARDLLAAVENDAPAPLGRDLAAVIQRLDLTLSNLPDFPVAASDDLDIAWQVLLAGLPQTTPTPSPTPSPIGTLSPTPSAADMTITPTARASVQPTATP